MEKEKIPFGYRLARGVLGPIFKLFYHPTIIGKEKVPTSGAILVCGNHVHLYDQCLPIISTKRFLRYMAKKEYFDGPFAWFFRFVGCIPVNRSIKDTNAKEAAIEHLKQEGAIGIFPEGTRNKTDAFLLPFKYGAVSMAQKTNAKIVPFAITGDYKITNKDLTIRFGDPFDVNDMTLEEANRKLEEAVAKLKLNSLQENEKRLND